MLRHSRTFFVSACFAVLIAALAFIGSRSPSYQKCTAEHERHDSNNERSALKEPIAGTPQIPLFLVCEGAFVDENNGTLTALATIAIAGFTLTLWRATTRQAALTREAIELGNREFAATHRPKLILREAFSVPPDPPRGAIAVSYTIANVGASDCWMTEAHMGIEWVHGPYPVEMMTPDRAFTNDVPFIGRIRAGERKQLTFVDRVQKWHAETIHGWAAEFGVHFVGHIAYIDAPGSNVTRHMAFRWKWEPTTQRFRRIWAEG